MRRPKSLSLPYPWYLEVDEWREIQDYVDQLSHRLALMGINPHYPDDKED